MLKKLLLSVIGLGVITLSMTEPANAAGEDTAYVFNTLLFLIGGFLVMWMAAGFAMLEAGMVRSRSVAMQCTKNIALYSIAGIAFWVLGYNLMYDGVDGGYFGSFTAFSVPDPSVDTGDYSAASDWFFQMVFCATAASIVSGTLAERIKLIPFLIFVVILCGIIYPIQGAWQWGGGFLSELGFSDFAGSTIVHSTGGWAALMGALILGSRAGRYNEDGTVNAMPGSSMPLATLGTFILWLGWFGFNGGSQLALGSFDDATAVATIYINTNLAACAGVLVCAAITRLVRGKTDVVMMLNGALGGLVAITAEPLMPTPLMAIIIGGIGGALVFAGTELLTAMKIDDVVGAIPVHLIAGVWGTLAVPITNPDTSFGTQFLGTASICVFVFVVSIIIWSIMKATIGIRISEEAEKEGTDVAETGVIAYSIRD